MLKALGPGVAISRARTMEDLVSANVAEPRFRTLLLSIFAIVSLALAAVGLYGVVAFSVSQRRSELGLRMALGADPADVLRLVLREGMTPVAAGILVGPRRRRDSRAGDDRRLLFGVDAFDPLTFAAVAGALTRGRAGRLLSPGPPGHAASIRRRRSDSGLSKRTRRRSSKAA